MAAAPAPTDPAVMIDVLVEEFLLRLPPDDPALLARAALVSRQWCRVVTGPSFRRRFRELYRSTPPLLGYVLSLEQGVRFVPLSTFRPPRTRTRTRLRGVRAVSSNHGRVLLRSFPLKRPGILLSVWHPITSEQQDLPLVPLEPYPYMANWDAAIVCAVGDGCDHLHCHFKVVFVGNHQDRNFSCVYSSEAGSWSAPVFSSERIENDFVRGQFILIGTALYTTCSATNEIFKYDLGTQQMCNISITPRPDAPPGIIGHDSTLITAEEGRLGFAKASNSKLCLWLSENGRLEESRAIDLRTLLPAAAFLDPPFVVAFAETGAGVIFLWTRVGCFAIDLKSGCCKKIGKASEDRAVPYVSFCTPAPAAGVVISSDEVPVADVAVSTDSGPGAGVAVSADEGQELLHVSSS